MNVNRLPNFSFNFKGRNSRTDFGIVAKSHDLFLPEKRERKQFVPFQHGQRDLGAHWFNERQLRVRCVWISAVLKRMTRSDIREVAYWLSQKGKIEFPEEPDKYYVGEIYDSNDLISHYNYARENPENGSKETTDGEFELNFVCEPFAYREVPTQFIQSGINRIEYKGTAETPCTIILKNNNDFAVENVQIVVSRRKV